MGSRAARARVHTAHTGRGERLREVPGSGVISEFSKFRQCCGLIKYWRKKRLSILKNTQYICCLFFFPFLTRRLPESWSGARRCFTSPLPRQGCGPHSHFPFVSAVLLIKGERHTPSQGTAASPRPSQPLLPLPAQDACGNAALAARIFPSHSGGRRGLGQQRTRLFIGIIKLPCNLTNNSGLNWLLLRPQSGKRKKLSVLQRT